MAEGTTMSTRRKTTLAIIDAYNAWDLDAIVSLRTDDCVQTIGPESLGREPMTNATYRAFFGAVMPRISNFRLVAKDIIEDPIANKVVVWASSTADTAAGPGTYGNEYFLLFHFNEAGDKTTKMLEFVDSAKSREQRAVLVGQ